MTSFHLEKSAQELTELLAKAPPLTGLPLEDARKAAEAAQSAPIPMPDVDESWVTVWSPGGEFKVRVVRPKGCRPHSSSWTRTMCCAIRAKRTRTSSVKQGSRRRRSVSTARSMTLCG
jgi:hypothetical protein